jgi:hypothetical protein
MKKLSSLWILKTGLALFWLSTSFFMYHPFYTDALMYYLKQMAWTLGGNELIQYCVIFHIFEKIIFFLCFLQLVLGFYVLIYPSWFILFFLQFLFTFILSFGFFFFDGSLGYHPFGALSKSFTIFGVIYFLRAHYRVADLEKYSQFLLGSLALFWIYEGLFPCILYQSPFKQEGVALLFSCTSPQRFLQGLGAFQIAYGLSLFWSLYRFPRLLKPLLLGQMALLILLDTVSLAYFPRYLYHPLGPITKDFVLLAASLYLFVKPPASPSSLKAQL